MIVGKLFIGWSGKTHAQTLGIFKNSTPHRKLVNSNTYEYFDLVKKQFYPWIAFSKNSKCAI